MLWFAVIVAVLGLVGCRDQPAPRPRPVTAAEWKAVIQDAYDARIDRRHRCAAVRKAIARLPTSMTYCGLCDELEAYERKVC